VHHGAGFAIAQPGAVPSISLSFENVMRPIHGDEENVTSEGD
jgi:hypothetical protein